MSGNGLRREPRCIEDVKALGSVIRARRKELRLTLDEASLRLGIGRRLLLELERGEREGASIGTVLSILQRLGYDVMLQSRGAE
ncbi:helix-turn-helix domain-containing protein [Gemmatimonadota bacterium]